MATLKEALLNLSPIPWSSVPTDDLKPFLHEAFANAELLLNSVPITSASSSGSKAAPSPTSEQKSHRATTPSETLITAYPTAVDERNVEWQKQWGKPIKLGSKENPLNVSVYKMAAFDRHGAWFARRSYHKGMDFTLWKHAMRREFVESCKVKAGPGAGAVRGIAADRRLEKKTVTGLGIVEVWQLSSAFPGPVTPREFVALLCTSDNALSEASSYDSESPSTNIPRHFVIVSRPTTHSDAELDKNLVHGTYESVEMIREIPENEDDPTANTIEWIMVTRSDPGGGIPKFMVERGTPGSIVADVPKLIDWAIHIEDLPEWNEEEEDARLEAAKEAEPEEQNLDIENWKTATSDIDTSVPPAQLSKQTSRAIPDSPHGNSTLLGSLTSAIGSTISPYLPYLPYDKYGKKAKDVDSESEDDTSSSLSEAPSSGSDATFASAPEPRSTTETERPRSPLSLDSGEIRKPANSHEKQLSKISQQRAELDARIEKARAEDAKKEQDVHSREEQESAKAQERRERERKKTEDRYRREMDKLEERRQREEQKAEQARVKEEKRVEDRRRKALEKDVLTKTQRERDEARKKLEMLTRENEVMRSQIEELQRENTNLVQKLGASGESGLEAVRKIREEASSSMRSRASSRSHRSGESKEHLDS